MGIGLRTHVSQVRLKVVAPTSSTALQRRHLHVGREVRSGQVGGHNNRRQPRHQHRCRLLTGQVRSGGSRAVTWRGSGDTADAIISTTFTIKLLFVHAAVSGAIPSARGVSFKGLEWPRWPRTRVRGGPEWPSSIPRRLQRAGRNMRINALRGQSCPKRTQNRRGQSYTDITDICVARRRPEIIGSGYDLRGRAGSCRRSLIPLVDAVDITRAGERGRTRR